MRIKLAGDLEISSYEFLSGLDTLGLISVKDDPDSSVYSATEIESNLLKAADRYALFYQKLRFEPENTQVLDEQELSLEPQFEVVLEQGPALEQGGHVEQKKEIATVQVV